MLKLFNAVDCIGKIPTVWKQGRLIPIYKGGGEPKPLRMFARVTDHWTCCHASLSFLKKLILSRIAKHILHYADFPNSQQQGFQKNLGC